MAVKYLSVIITNTMFFWLVFFVIIYLVHKLYIRRPMLELNKSSIVVITGACNGIGRQTAKFLAQRHQCKLIILDIMSSKFKEVQAELEALGSSVVCFKCDLSSENSMNDVLKDIRTNIGSSMIDVLINNAGIVIPKDFDQLTYADHVKTMAVNYHAPVFFTINLKDKLKGHVVTIASIAALLRGKKLTSYAASKHAIYGFFNCMRTELAGAGKKDITCSTVCPYAIDTGFFTGFETRLNNIVPMLKEAEVGRIVADTVLNREEVVFIPFWMGFVVKLTSLLPDFYLDRLTSWLDTSTYAGNPGLKK